MTIASLWLGKGAVVPLHSHVNEQVTMLKTGALRVRDGRRDLRAEGRAMYW